MSILLILNKQGSRYDYSLRVNFKSRKKDTQPRGLEKFRMETDPA